MTDQTSQPDDLGRRVLGIALRAAGAALVQVSNLLDASVPGEEDCGCDVPEDSPLIAEFTWEARFASEVPDNALLAVDGRAFDARPGLRALRVTKRKSGERQSPFGGVVESVTFLVADVDSGEPFSLGLSADSSLRVAVEVPDSVAGLGGTA